MNRTGHVARVRQATARLALAQAKYVPWPHLAKVADEYTEWHVFALWARAIVDAAADVPIAVRTEIERRAPGVYGFLRPRLESLIDHGERPGILVWEDMTCWFEMNVFLPAKRQGWLDAVRYFSTMSLRSMKAWSQWEYTDALWRNSSPRRFPPLQEWGRAVDSVTRLSNPNSAAQRALHVVQAISESDWRELFAGFSRLNAFSQWMTLLLDARDGADQVSRELLNCYPHFGFSACSAAPKKMVRRLQSWVLNNEIRGTHSTDVLPALRFHLRSHPEYSAIRRYAQFCRRIWPNDLSRALPTFAEWKRAADSYSELR